MQISIDYLLQITNETLTATTVIVAASMLLYYLSRNLHSRVARASSVLLAAVTIVSLIDMVTVLDPTSGALEAWLRVQWLGIAFTPAALFHLSDALLATTGLVSRGRRRRVNRMLYILSSLFFIMAMFTDVLVYGLVEEPAPHLLPGPVFVLYIAYFLIATLVSFYNVWRARNRCLTTYTHRRMGYLLFSFTLPAFGIFPYSLLFADSSGSSLLFWLFVNLSNFGIAFMLLFMAYPLSFFGSSIPDRVVKSELLHFFLRGPAAGILVLLVVIYVPQAGLILGLPGQEMMPFAAVAIVMFWQWMVSLVMPLLDRYVVYQDEQSQMRMVQSISQRLLTQNDLKQLFEAILAAVCDLLQVPVAFIASIEGDTLRINETVGGWKPNASWENGGELLKEILAEPCEQHCAVQSDTFWVVPLFSERIWEAPANGKESRRLLGVLAIKTDEDIADLPSEEQLVFDVLVHQAAQALDDQLLQMEVFAALEGLLPEMDAIQRLRDAARYGDYPTLALAERNLAVASPADFVDAVRDALRDYWGGPRLTHSALLNLNTVQTQLAENDNNPTRTLRAVLLDAVNKLRPAGERSMTRAEWTLYNIVELRFIQGYKVRDVAKRLAMSEADLYRKQRVAIEEVARVLAEMEQNT